MEQQYLTVDLNELKERATFETINEMDNTIYEYIERLRGDKVPESVIEVLRFFGRSSLRVLGVSFAKYETIAESIGYSRRTVLRAVKVLESYGIIEKIPTLRSWKGRSKKRSVNVIRVLAAPQGGTPMEAHEVKEDKGCEPNVFPEPPKNKHYQELLHNTADKVSESTSPYVRFKELIDDKKLRNKLYGVYLAHIRHIKGIYDTTVLLKVGIKALMVTFKTSRVRNKVGYFSAVLDRMLDELHYATLETLR
ncbi:MAG TPA: helix-turn-helix domain-containing protein [Bacillus sp. (in: firmicutes)]|uniref:helix-turn-helix domain-containing protein n=1 Tax=Bacillus litorisediminis TaxID=2922713 RepID=UPI001FAFA0B5|nr:helix-turn-helix domain-containing protein [Bacillus litorisediminis]HWO74384.1 helix-turn-helix domain-containing protein [Bacillus sp. (in: firmicutes)]